MEHSQIISDILYERQISAYKIAKETGISESLFSKWKKSPTSEITSEKLAKIADYLNVSVDYLLGRTENIAVLPAQINFDGLNEQENKIINFFRSLNDEGQEKAFDYITDLVDTNKYKKHNKLDVGKEA